MIFAPQYTNAFLSFLYYVYHDLFVFYYEQENWKKVVYKSLCFFNLIWFEKQTFYDISGI